MEAVYRSGTIATRGSCYVSVPPPLSWAHSYECNSISPSDSAHYAHTDLSCIIT